MDMVSDWAKDPLVFKIIITILVTAVFYLLGVLFVGKIVKSAVKTRGRNWHKKDIEKRQKTLAALFTTMWRIIVLAVGIFYIAQEIFHFNAAPLFASAGVLGVALGFGAQSLVQDFISGIFIISENQYRVGDIVDIEGFGGTVERIGVRSTVVRDVDGNVHYFPNGMVQHVINKTMGYSMARLVVGVAPASDIDRVIEIVNETGAALAEEEKWNKKIIDAPSFISVGEFTATNVDILMAGKTQPSDQWSVIAEMRRRLFERFEKENIKLGTTLALPQPPKK